MKQTVKEVFNIRENMPFEESKYDDGENIYTASDLYREAREKKLQVFDFDLRCLSDYTSFHLSFTSFVEHINRVKKCSLKYPILISRSGNILDGRHRIIKAIQKGDQTIKAIRLPYIE